MELDAGYVKFTIGGSSRRCGSEHRRQACIPIDVCERDDTAGAGVDVDDDSAVEIGHHVGADSILRIIHHKGDAVPGIHRQRNSRRIIKRHPAGRACDVQEVRRVHRQPNAVLATAPQVADATGDALEKRAGRPQRSVRFVDVHDEGIVAVGRIAGRGHDRHFEGGLTLPDRLRLDFHDVDDLAARIRQAKVFGCSGAQDKIGGRACPRQDQVGSKSGLERVAQIGHIPQGIRPRQRRRDLKRDLTGRVATRISDADAVEPGVGISDGRDLQGGIGGAVNIGVIVLPLVTQRRGALGLDVKHGGAALLQGLR